MPTLVIIRHGQSQWNEQNLFTGWRDPDLTARGEIEAKGAGQRLREAGINFDVAFTSSLTRAQHTLNIVLNELGQTPPVTKNEKLNERDYGELSGQNKAEAAEKFGADQVHIWRRSFDVPPPGGESLAMTAERVLPHFDDVIAPCLDAGENVLIAAHGNSLRALVMRLEKVSPEEIVKCEIPTGQPWVYTLDDDGTVVKKDILS